MAKPMTEESLTVDAMPEGRRGRRGFDLEPLIEKLQDGQRRAARSARMAVETSYVREERRLYFPRQRHGRQSP